MLLQVKQRKVFEVILDKLLVPLLDHGFPTPGGRPLAALGGSRSASRSVSKSASRLAGACRRLLADVLLHGGHVAGLADLATAELARGVEHGGAAEGPIQEELRDVAEPGSETGEMMKESQGAPGARSFYRRLFQVES